MMAIGTLMLSATLNVSASEAPAPGEAGETEETGKLRIACTYSSDITPDEGDTFTISYVLTGLTEEGFVVNDPNSIERSERAWTYEEISGQIRNIWAFDKAPEYWGA